MSTPAWPPPLSLPQVTGTGRAVLRSAAHTFAMLGRGGLAMSRARVGGRVTFADGTTSVVFRETAVPGAVTSDPAMLVVSFRLRLIGRSHVLHTGFRHECVLHTPLFAGFPGFRAKLWLWDLTTFAYRGLYAWEGASPAEYYASRLARVLDPVCVRGTVAFHVAPGVALDEALRWPSAAIPPGPTRATEWWRPSRWAEPRPPAR